jgi:hypothetical protein
VGIKNENCIKIMRHFRRDAPPSKPLGSAATAPCNVLQLISSGDTLHKFTLSGFADVVADHPPANETHRPQL